MLVIWVLRVAGRCARGNAECVTSASRQKDVLTSEQGSGDYAARLVKHDQLREDV
jgi:hypothetical protein